MRTYGRQPRVGAQSAGFVGYSCIVSGNTFTTTDGYPGAPWSGGATATSPFATVSVQATVTAAMVEPIYFTMGLNQTPVVPMGSSYVDWDYAFTCNGGAGHYAVTINGVIELFDTVTPKIGDVMTVAYNGTQCVFLVNGAVIYTAQAIIQYAPVYPGWASYYANDTITLALNPTAPGVGYQWVEVSTDANGNNDLVNFTTLCQVLGLNLNESPFYATLGIPAQQAVQQQIAPDVYVAQTQQLFAPYFRSLLITKKSSRPPTYQVLAVTHTGVALTAYSPPPF